MRRIARVLTSPYPAKQSIAPGSIVHGRLLLIIRI